MKLATFSPRGGTARAGVLVGEHLYDVAEVLESLGGDLPQVRPLMMLDLIARREDVLPRLAAAVEHGMGLGTPYALDEVDWEAPVPNPSKVVCIALNNRSLDAIKIKAPTDHPAFFLKPSTAVTGHRRAIVIKPEYGFTHPEPELGVVIGERLSEASPEEAMSRVFGYVNVNDVTCVGMRDEDSFSLRYFRPDPQSGQLVEDVAYTSYPGRYKASDTFAPMGPYLVTKDEIPDPADLAITCRMGDRLVASDHSRNYVWDIPNALSHISRTMTLLPGDIVSMGTAVGGDQSDASAPHIPGVTRCNINGFEGPVEVEITGLGKLVNHVRSRRDRG